eukprot:TRINITY_DN13733_c0_g1_i1.p1 TRINITY_DN13733_c0_g1~~TRINITY_DN13733_c0_g1_i1.p1  ORF type:complete len:177 (+),score=30.73 TRINITY_DN13733_c0_g1_i1:77-607(+)
MAQAAPLVDSPALEAQLLPKLIVRTATNCAMQRLAAKTAAEGLGSGWESSQLAAHVADPPSCVDDLPDVGTKDETAPRTECPVVVSDFVSKEGHTSRGDIAKSSRPSTASTHWSSPTSGSLPVIEEGDFEDDASSCASSEFSEYGADEGTYAARLERSHFAKIDTFDSLESIFKRR